MVLLVDSINGYFKLTNSSFTFPFSQIYKTGILILIIVRLQKKATYLLGVFGVFALLLLPTILQMTKGTSFALYADSLKIIKYITPYICFVYFKELFLQNDNRLIKRLFFFVKASYIIIVANVLLKSVGLGFSLYRSGIGSKGYIYAGNEISTVFLITYSILAYRLLVRQKTLYFWFLFLFTANISFVLGSKSAIAGIVLITLLMRVRPLAILASSRKLGNFIVVSAFIVPLAILLFVRKLVSSELFQNRILYYYERMDILTLILSSRNLYLEKVSQTYLNEYNILEKLVGVGQSVYENNTDRSVEIEFLDIFFAYGFVGLFLFLGMVFLTYRLLKTRKNNNENPFSRLAYVSFLLLLAISSLAGHVFSSGIAGIFIGFIFASTYIKKTV